MSLAADLAAGAAALLALAGCAYLALAWAAVARFARRPADPAPAERPPVTILKPLHGEDPDLYANLLSFCRQAYPTVQVVFGVRDPADPAIGVVERLKADLPGADLALVLDPRVHGANLKMSNVINMMAAARHPVLVLADSDMRVPPDYLDQLVGGLARPGVGLVTCLYVGRPGPGLASRLGAQFINYGFLPSVLVGAMLRPWPGCFGATMALRRELLERLGGFARFKDLLADDYRLGAAVIESGAGVHLSRCLVEDVLVEPGLGAMLAHELRWSRTIRSIAPLDYAGSIVTYPVAFALLAALLAGLSPAGLGFLGAVLAWRLIVVRGMARSGALAAPPLWAELALVPVRDVLSFGLVIASFCGKTVRWRGRDFRLARDGSLTSE